MKKKNGFIMYFALILNEFGPNKHDCITLGFADNGYFSNKKGMEKLI